MLAGEQARRQRQEQRSEFGRACGASLSGRARGQENGRYDLAASWMQRALRVEPGAAWINRSLAVAYDRIGERQAAERSLLVLRRSRPDIRVRDVALALHFPPDFVSRIANGLSDLGLSP